MQKSRSNGLKALLAGGAVAASAGLSGCGALLAGAIVYHADTRAAAERANAQAQQAAARMNDPRRLEDISNINRINEKLDAQRTEKFYRIGDVILGPDRVANFFPGSLKLAETHGSYVRDDESAYIGFRYDVAQINVGSTEMRFRDRVFLLPVYFVDIECGNGEYSYRLCARSPSEANEIYSFLKSKGCQ